VIRFDGNAVRTHRLDLSLSTRGLASAVGVAPSLIDKIESRDGGQAIEIGMPQLQRLVDALGVPLGALLADDTPQTPDAAGAHAPEAGPDDMTTSARCSCTHA